MMMPREKLYDEVCAEPMTTVAKRLGRRSRAARQHLARHRLRTRRGPLGCLVRRRAPRAGCTSACFATVVLPSSPDQLAQVRVRRVRQSGPALAAGTGFALLSGMKRDHRLRGLSSDHHHVLALARRLASNHQREICVDRERLGTRLRDELEPHFQAEEHTLLDVLKSAGGAALADRLADEHAALRALFARVLGGVDAAAGALAELLTAHVRWEERELFPWCEAHLPPAALDRIDAAAPHLARPSERPPLPHAYVLPQPAAGAAAPSEEQLAVLIPAFYAEVQRDPLLGPVFADAVADWPHHLAKLVDFWSRAMLGTSRFSGNPMAAHRKHLDRISPAHFERWLLLWSRITAAQLPAPIATALQEKAARMAVGLQGGLFGNRPSEAGSAAGT